MPGMSDKKVFQIFYGEGEIGHGLYGVDLSGFPYIHKVITRANERTIEGIKSWLIRVFQLDPRMHRLKLKGLASCACDAFFGELISLNATSTWRSYIDMATERDWPLILLAQAYNIENPVVEEGARPSNVGALFGEESFEHNEEAKAGDHYHEEDDNTAPTEPMGYADEAEQFEHLVDQIRMDDLEDQMVPDEVSSEDDAAEPIPMPAEWNNTNFASLSVSEGFQVPWEYHANEVSEGSIYPTKDAVVEAVKLWALSERRQFIVDRSTRKVYEIR